ncbi:MAG: hypothetical protein FWH03_04595 [Firmicutes bacterium]|nr:hypothetical protein [Bacillota bacterium]
MKQNNIYRQHVKRNISAALALLMLFIAVAAALIGFGGVRQAGANANDFWGYSFVNSGNGTLGANGTYRVAFAPDGSGDGADLSTNAMQNGNRANWYHSTWGDGNRNNDSLYAQAHGTANGSRRYINQGVGLGNATQLINTNFDKFIFDLNSVQTVSGIGYYGRTDSANNGRNTITRAEVWVLDASVTHDVSVNKAEADNYLLNMTANANWKLYANTATWNNTTQNQEKIVRFEPIQARYIALRFRALDSNQLTASNMRIFGETFPHVAGMPGVQGATQSNNGGEDVRRTNDIHFNDFNADGSSTAPNSKMTAPANYNARDQRANGLAHAWRDNTASGVGNRHASAVMQAWIGIGGDFRTAILNGLLTTLSVDIAHGLGVRSQDVGTGNSANFGTETYVDVSFGRDPNPLAFTRRTGSSDYASRNRLESLQGDIFATTRNHVPGRTGGTTSGSGWGSWGIKDGWPNGSTNGNWDFGSTAVTFNADILTALANNGGFWIKLSAHTTGYSSTPSMAQVAVSVLEGVRLNYTFADRSATFNTNVNGTEETISTQGFTKASNATLSETAPIKDNVYFTSWSGAAANVETVSSRTVTTHTYPHMRHNAVLTAQYAPIPAITDTSLVFDGTPKIPASPLAGYSLADAVFSGTAFDGTVYENSPHAISAGNLTVTANVVNQANNEVVGRMVDFAFTIHRSEGEGTVSLEGWVFGDDVESDVFTPVLSGVPDEYGAPQYFYQISQSGSWISQDDIADFLPLTVGLHNIRASFDQTDNYLAYTTPVASFRVSKRAVEIPEFSQSFTFNRTEYDVSEFIFDTDLYTVTASSVLKQTDAGTYTVRLRIRDVMFALYHWEGEEENQQFVNLSWEITAKSIGEGALSLAGVPENGFIFNNSEQRPLSLTAADGDFILTEGDDYEVTLPVESTVAGTKTVEVVFKGNYAGQAEISYTIRKSVVAIPQGAEHIYNGGEQSAGDFVDGNEFFFAVTNTGTLFATDAGTYSVRVELFDSANYGWDNGQGAAGAGAQRVISWRILPKELDETALSLAESTVSFTQSGRVPTLIVLDGDTVLVEGVDYEVIIEDDIVALGVKTLTVEFKGNYAGEGSIGYEVVPSTNGSLALANSSFIFNGSAQTPELIVKDGDFTLTEDVDYTVSVTDNINAGTATVTVTFIGNYTGEVSETFTIAQSENGELVLGSSSFIFNGSAQTPELTVKDGGTVLTEGTDYTVNVTDNINAGTATVTVTFIGNYTGEASETFTIAQSTNGELVLANSDFIYNGSAQTPEITVKDGGTVLTEGTDYTVSISDNSNAGTVTVTVTFMGNYTGTAIQTYSIAQNENGTLTLGANEFTFNGSAQTPDIIVKDGDTVLSEGTDYTVSISDNINAGTVTVTVTFTGNYTGTVSETYGIAKAESEVTPDYTLSGVLYTTSTLPSLTLLSGNTSGTFTWLAHTVKEGTHNYEWQFTPDNGNYTVITGFISFTATEAVIDRIELNTPPDKLIYAAFEVLDFTGLRIEIINQDGNSAGFISLTDSDAFSIVYQNGDSFRAGDTTVTIIYQGKELTITLSAAVSKANAVYTLPTQLTAVYGQTLSAVTLPFGFTWESAPDTAVGEAGTRTFNATFTPTDTDNYLVATGIALTVEVSKAASTVNPVIVNAPDVFFTTSDLPLLSLSLGDTDGVITWDALQTVAEGLNAYTWTFIPYNANYETVYGDIEFLAVVPELDYLVVRSVADTLAYLAFEAFDVSGMEVEIFFTDGLSRGFIDLTDTDAFGLVYQNGGETFFAGETFVTLMYGGATIEIELDGAVLKLTPSYTAPSGLTARFGQTLSAVTLPNGFTWENPQTLSAVGAQSFTVRFTPADTVNFAIIEGISVSVEVQRAVSVVTPVYDTPETLFTTDALPALSLSDGDTQGTIVWDSLTVVAGEFAYGWTFTPTDTDNYEILQGTVTFTAVEPAVTVLVLAEPPHKTAYNAFDTFNADGIKLELKSNNGASVGFIDLLEGEYSLIYQNGGETFFAGETAITLFYQELQVQISVSVSKINPQFVIPAGLTATFGDTLSKINLPVGWAWVNASAKAGDAGVRTHAARFTPQDTVNYNAVTVDISVTVERATGTAPEAEAQAGTRSITVTVDWQPATGSTLEYAICTTPEPPADSSAWQDSATFDGLEEDTEYFVFVRVKADENHHSGAPKIIEVKTEAASTPPPPPPNGGGKGLSGGAITGIILAAVAALAAAGFTVYWFVLRKKKPALSGAQADADTSIDTSTETDNTETSTDTDTITE